MQDDYSIECALIEAENNGLEGDAALEYAALKNKVPKIEAERVHRFLYDMQNRISDRLGIAI